MDNTTVITTNKKSFNTYYFLDKEQNKKTYKNGYLLLQNVEIKRPLMNIFDSMFAIFFVAPNVVGFWRGTWQLMDLYQEYFPIFEGLICGFLTNFIFTMIQTHFYQAFIVKDKINWNDKIIREFFKKFYTYIFGIVCIMTWRSAWGIIDYYFNITYNNAGAVQTNETTTLLIFINCLFLACLVCLKCLKCCLAVPFVICMDSKEQMFDIPTRFRKQIGERTSLYVLDCLFSVLIVGTLVVFVWRGAWAILDIFLFPNDEILSAWGSLVIGYLTVAIAFLMQPLMRWVCEHLKGATRLLAADLFILFSFFGTVNVWRGIWNLLNIYLLPDHFELSCWLTHWFCLILLILLGCSNSLLVRGVYIDAEEPAGKCVVFPCYYLRIIFQNEKMKKIQHTDKSEKTEMQSEHFDNNHVICTISQQLENNHI